MAPYDLLEKEPAVGKPPGAEVRLGRGANRKRLGLDSSYGGSPSPCPWQSQRRCPSEGTGCGCARAGIMGVEMGNLPPEALLPRLPEGQRGPSSSPVLCAAVT